MYLLILTFFRLHIGYMYIYTSEHRRLFLFHTHDKVLMKFQIHLWLHHRGPILEIDKPQTEAQSGPVS